MKRKLLVYAPWPRGGHPEYVAHFVGGILSNTPSMHADWPVAPDAEPQVGHERMRFLRVLPSSTASSHLRRRGNVAARRQRTVWRRPDIRFLIWAAAKGRGRYHWVIVEEIHRFSLPLFVLVCKLLGAKVAVHVHNVVRHDERQGFLASADRLFTGLGLRQADLVLVHSTENARLAELRFGVGPPLVVRHGLQGRATTPELPSVRPKELLFFGVNRREKGLRTAVEALGLLKDECTLVVAGATPHDYREEVASLIARVPGARWYEGHVESSDVGTYFQNAWAVVLPYERFEAQSGVLHLALEWGVPFVATPVGGLVSAAEETGAGVCSSTVDARSLADAILELLSEEKNLRLRQAAIASHAALAWETVTKDLAVILGGD